MFLEQRSLANLDRNALVSGKFSDIKEFQNVLTIVDAVFLRVLEYYDGAYSLPEAVIAYVTQTQAYISQGILILTTNRVGTFDEAFKSRIQLNLRYSNLDVNQRLKIWNNSIIRLERLVKDETFDRREHGVDSEQIRRMLPTLAKENLNGREIRNAISTARQLCSYKGEPLKYEHLRHVIEETKKFEEYLTSLHGFSADEIQHDLGAR